MLTLLLLGYISKRHRDLYEVIKADIFSVCRACDFGTIKKHILFDIECRINFYFRVSSFFKKRNAFLRKILNHKYETLSAGYCINILSGTEIGKGFRIGHIGNITVHCKTVIGSYVTVSQGVTLGKIHKGRKAGTPVLGNEIYIAPNAVVVGNIRIGNNVMISANSFVNFDVPDNSIVLGNPGTIHQNAAATKGILNIYQPAEENHS